MMQLCIIITILIFNISTCMHDDMNKPLSNYTYHYLFRLFPATFPKSQLLFIQPCSYCSYCSYSVANIIRRILGYDYDLIQGKNNDCKPAQYIRIAYRGNFGGCKLWRNNYMQQHIQWHKCWRINYMQQHFQWHKLWRI